MTLSSKRPIASEFLAAANKVISDKRKQEAEMARQVAERLHRQTLAERRTQTARKTGFAKYEQQLGLVMNALEALPEKDGKKFTVTESVSGNDNGRYYLSVQIRYGTPNYADHSKAFWVESVYKNGAKTDENFAACRTEIGAWVGHYIPERVNELQKLLAPKAPRASAKPCTRKVR